MTSRDPDHLRLLDRITAITGHPYAGRDQCLLNCDLGTITLGDVADLCAAIADLRTMLARNLVMDMGSGEDGAEMLGGLVEVFRMVDDYRAANPLPPAVYEDGVWL